MKKFLFSLSLLPLLASCTPTVPQAEYDRMKAMNDSLSEVAEGMEMVIATISSTMDDMAAEEGMLFIDDNGNDLKDKQAVLSHMKSFREHMAQQRQQVADLEKQLSGNKAYSSKLQKVIDNLNQQIAQKDAQIAEMQTELEKKNSSIADLKQQLETVSRARQMAEESRDYFIDVARAQDNALNTVYYVIGTKAELKDLGLVEGVFKKKADYASFDASKFTKADLREVTELVLQSKKPKLVTEKPEGSYTLKKNDDGTTTLTIDEPEKFWAGSPYLVIML